MRLVKTLRWTFGPLLHARPALPARLPGLALGAALMFSLWACDSRTAPADDAGSPDSHIVAPQEAGPDTIPATRFVFKPDPSAVSPAVLLKAGEVTGGKVWIEVITRGVTSLQGIAFRLTFDPQRVKVLSSEAGKAWSLSAVKTVHKFTVRKEGELWAGLGHYGMHGLNGSSPVTVARIQLQLSGSTSIALDFRPHHNMVLDDKGKVLKPKWLGGTFEPEL